MPQTRSDEWHMRAAAQLARRETGHKENNAEKIECHTLTCDGTKVDAGLAAARNSDTHTVEG